MKIYYKDQIKFEIFQALKEPPASTPEIDTILLNTFEFQNLVLSYPNLDIRNDEKGKRIAVLDGITIIELL